MYIYMYTCMYVCIYIYMYVYIYMCVKSWKPLVSIDHLFKVTRGILPEAAIRKTIENDRLWYQEIGQGDYFAEKGFANPQKRKPYSDAAQASPPKQLRKGGQQSAGSGKGSGNAKGGGKGTKKGACWVYNLYKCNQSPCPKGFDHECQVCGSTAHRKDFHKE